MWTIFSGSNNAEVFLQDVARTWKPEAMLSAIMRYCNRKIIILQRQWGISRVNQIIRNTKVPWTLDPAAKVVTTTLKRVPLNFTIQKDNNILTFLSFRRLLNSIVRLVALNPITVGESCFHREFPTGKHVETSSYAFD